MFFSYIIKQVFIWLKYKLFLLNITFVANDYCLHISIKLNNSLELLLCLELCLKLIVILDTFNLSFHHNFSNVINIIHILVFHGKYLDVSYIFTL